MILFARRGPAVLARRSQRPPLSARAGQRELRFTAAERKKKQNKKNLACRTATASVREERTVVSSQLLSQQYLPLNGAV